MLIDGRKARIRRKTALGFLCIRWGFGEIAVILKCGNPPAKSRKLRKSGRVKSWVAALAPPHFTSYAITFRQPNNYRFMSHFKEKTSR